MLFRVLRGGARPTRIRSNAGAVHPSKAYPSGPAGGGHQSSCTLRNSSRVCGQRRPSVRYVAGTVVCVCVEGSEGVETFLFVSFSGAAVTASGTVLRAVASRTFTPVVAIASLRVVASGSACARDAWKGLHTRSLHLVQRLRHGGCVHTHMTHRMSSSGVSDCRTACLVGAPPVTDRLATRMTAHWQWQWLATASCAAPMHTAMSSYFHGATAPRGRDRCASLRGGDAAPSPSPSPAPP